MRVLALSLLSDASAGGWKGLSDNIDYFLSYCTVLKLKKKIPEESTERT